MRGANVLLCAAALLLPAGLLQQAEAQVSIQIGGAPPSCPYGYYNYAPYRCAPRGYWGSNYFYNGIFLGVGPWANWGYNHGWGHHHFSGARRSNDRPGYHGGGHSSPHGRPGGGRPETHGNVGHGSPSHGGGHATGGHPTAGHASGGHASGGHASGGHASSSHGGDSHGGGGHDNGH
jgi:hypothetical protein